MKTWGWRHGCHGVTACVSSIALTWVGCASQHSRQARGDAATAELDAAPMAPDADEQTEVPGWETEEAGIDASEAAAAPDAARQISCQLCLDYTHGPRLYVTDRGDQTCTVLHLVWGGKCDGLDLGRAELCLEQVALWPHAETCPPEHGEIPFMASTAQGSVVGHEGIIGIKIQLAFEESPMATKSIDFETCKPDYLETKPPCP